MYTEVYRLVSCERFKLWHIVCRGFCLLPPCHCRDKQLQWDSARLRCHTSQNVLWYSASSDITSQYVLWYSAKLRCHTSQYVLCKLSYHIVYALLQSSYEVKTVQIVHIPVVSSQPECTSQHYSHKCPWGNTPVVARSVAHIRTNSEHPHIQVQISALAISHNVSNILVHTMCRFSACRKQCMA